MGPGENRLQEGKMRQGLRFLLVGGVIALGVTAGICGLVFSRFDLDRYREVFESRLSREFNVSVDIGRLSVSAKKIPGIEISSLRVDGRSKKTPIFSAHSILLYVDLLTFFVDGLTVRCDIEEGQLAYPSSQDSDFFLEVFDIKGDLEASLLTKTIRGAGEGRLLEASERDLAWRAEMDAKSQRVTYEVRIQGNQLHAQGESLAFQGSPQFKGRMDFNGFDVGRAFTLLAKTRGGEIGIAGILYGAIHLEGSGKKWSEVRPSLLGMGKIEVRDGALTHFNVIRAILTRITLIPGLGEVLAEALPRNWQNVLRYRDTPFELVEGEFEIQGNVVEIKSVVVKGKQYVIEAEGEIQLDGNLNLRGRLILLEELSQFLMSRVRELSFFANEQGRLIIPFFQRGNWSVAKPQPDLVYLGEKLLVDHAKRFLEKGADALSKWAGASQ